LTKVCLSRKSLFSLNLHTLNKEIPPWKSIPFISETSATESTFSFHTECKELIEQFTAETLGVGAQFVAYTDLLNQEDEALSVVRAC